MGLWSVQLSSLRALICSDLTRRAGQGHLPLDNTMTPSWASPFSQSHLNSHTKSLFCIQLGMSCCKFHLFPFFLLE